MPESTEDAEKRALRELEGKNIAFYSVLLSAWIETRMERDKTLVTLSAAAIGLLVTILTTAGAKHFCEILLFAVAVVSFLVTIRSSLVIYQLNCQHLEDAIRGSSERDPKLEKYDKRSLRAFIIGAIAALSIGISSASYQLTNTEASQMADKEKSSGSSGKPTTLKRSLDGITKLNPQAPQQTTKSPSQTQSDTANQNNSAGSSSNSEKK